MRSLVIAGLILFSLGCAYLCGLYWYQIVTRTVGDEPLVSPHLDTAIYAFFATGWGIAAVAAFGLGLWMLFRRKVVRE